MSSFKKAPIFFSTPVVRHVLFWIAVLGYFIITTEIEYFGSYLEAIESKSILVFMQLIVAYSSIYILMPRYLTPEKYVQFGLGLLLLLMIVYALFVCIQEFYFGPKYFVAEVGVMEYNSNEKFWKYIFNIPVFAGKSIKFLTPAILIVIGRFYKNQQDYLELNKQKKTNELAALKHQLNPHFLFNTLNNLYALSIDKSDEAPEVIEKLSEILDYMLYGCNDTYVGLQKEIELIDNYLALEKVRYGDRVAIQFDKKTEQEVIAPLILLTFIENAFIHGVSQELNEAYVEIKILVEENHVYFEIANSVAKSKVISSNESIGLTNVKKQLELLYIHEYSLDIKEEDNRYQVHLKLPAK